MEISSPSLGQQDNVGVSNGPLANSLFVAAPEGERPPSWQLDLIMEKLRQKSNQLKPLGETAKNIRAALSERRYFLDQGDRSHLQKCLDTLQQNIKVCSLQSMVERLEMVSRQLGLKFTPGATGNEWFISSDMFYLELLIDPHGMVQEVKIQHDGKTEQQNVPEMVDCLRRNDFTDFTAHLEGLVAIYQLNADKKIKSKAFIALQALEADLLAMASTYSHMSDGEAVVTKSLLGLVQPRKGGHPVKLVYFISPYEFLDVDSKVSLPTDVPTILEKKLGNVATVSIQATTSRKLQMSTTVSIMRTPDGKNVPRYGTLNATNSTALPACFTVNLGKPIPICKDLLQTIQSTTGIHCYDFSNPQPILNLVTQHASNGTLDCANNRGLFVALPDTPNTLQVHCYFMTETPHLEGILVSSIHFTLASQLPQVVAILRQQLIFNTLVASCVRVGSKPDMDCIVFEVNALSHQNVSVSFQHPLEDSLVTLEFDLRDVSHPMCRLHAVTTNAADIIPTLEEHACKVVQRSLSIPITVRAVIRRWQTMKSKYEPPNPEFNVPVGGSYGSDSLNQLQSNEISCGAESERAQSQQQQSSQPGPMVPGVVMGLNGAGNAPANSSLSTQQQSNNSSAPSSGRHPSGSNTYTISPIQSNNNNSGSASGNSGNMNNCPPPGTPSSAQNQQNPMDLISSYINPLFSLSNQLNLGNALPGNFPNIGGLTLQNLQNLTGLLDQVGQRGRRRKRKGTSSDSTTNQITGGPLNTQGNTTNVPRPSPSPSPKSPRLLPNKSPKRRPSEGSDISDTSQGDNTRAPTPQTPLTPRGDNSNSNAAINLLMTEMGLDIPDPRWNIDITPVGGSGNSSATQAMENFIASKLLTGFGSAAAASSNNTMTSSQMQGNEFSMENFDSDMEVEATGGGVGGPSSGNDFSNKFSIPQNKKLTGKKSRDFPKRSVSLDSHSTGLDELSSNLQSFLNSAVANSGNNDSAGVGSDFKPLVTPSLSITPVPTNSSPGQNTVNSLLANMRTGIEIIPLPNPVQIPNSITVTPINPKPLVQLSESNSKKNSKDKKNEDSNLDGGTTIKKKIGPAPDGSSKKERKRKASNILAPILDEEGLPIHDFNPGKQPKLLGPFGTVPGSGNFSNVGNAEKKGNAGMSVSLKNSSPPFSLNVKKPGSPNLNRAPNKSSSPTPKMGGKPSVSTLKSVSGSPKYPDISIQGSKSSKVKERKGGFQGNSKIAKNLSMVGNVSSVANLMPTLKSLDGNLPLSLASLNPSLLGLPSGNLKTEANMAEALLKANLLTQKLMDGNKQMQAQQGVTASASQLAQAAVAAQIAQRSNSTSSNNSSCSNNNNNGAGNSGKKGGLLAVIDKLKSQHSGDDSKKDMSKVDYLKASSAITSDVMQLTQQQMKKGSNNGNNGGMGGNGGSSSSSSGNNPEYMVKPGGQGLKMIVGKTKGSNISSLKDKLKLGLKAVGGKKGFSGIKPPSLGINTGKLNAPLGSAGSGGNGKKSGNGNGNKNQDKDPSSAEKKYPKNSSSAGNNGGGKPKEDEMDLTRKLFMPGSGVFDAPKFDFTKYQIPKKSSSSGGNGTSGTGAVGGNSDSPKNAETSPPTSSKDKEGILSASKDDKMSDTTLKNLEKDTSRDIKNEIATLQSSALGITSGNTVILNSETKLTSASTTPTMEQPPTKIKLSSASIQEIPFLEEMNKLFSKPFTSSGGSPINLSQSLSQLSKFTASSVDTGIAFGEPDSTTSEGAGKEERNMNMDHLNKEATIVATATGSAGIGTVVSETFISPESPDPLNNIQDDAIYKNTLTIPTTPLPTGVLPEETRAPLVADVQPSPIVAMDEDEDSLIIDVNLEKKNSESGSISSNGENLKNSNNVTASSSSSKEDEPVKVKDIMPPPPVPDSTSSSGFAVPLGNVISPAPNSSSVSSLIPNPVVTGSIVPPAPTVTPAITTVPIVSVHIVHSPQPNSPALLRSPLIVQSPHSSHASPYAIDDDLMDEALMGTGK